MECHLATPRPRAGNATDRNTLGSLAIRATATGVDPYGEVYEIVPWNPFDGNLALPDLETLTTEFTNLRRAFYNTTATVNLENHPQTSWTVTAIHLETRAKVPKITPEKFAEIAAGAKVGCPISRLLKAAEITLDAKLV